MEDKAVQFFKAALETSCYERKVLNLYNAFFCLYKEGCAAKAAELCAISAEEYLAAVEYCREDTESPRVTLSQNQLAKLESYIGSVLK